MGGVRIISLHGVTLSRFVHLEKLGGLIDAYQSEDSFGFDVSEYVTITANAVRGGALIHGFGEIGKGVGFSAIEVGLQSFTNFPNKAHSVLVSGNRGLSSWNGCPRWNGVLDASRCGFTSLAGLPNPWADTMTAVCHLRGNPINDLNGIENLTLGVLTLGLVPGMNALRIISAQKIIEVRIKAPGGEDIPTLNQIFQQGHNMYRESRNRAIMWTQKALVTAGHPDIANW